MSTLLNKLEGGDRRSIGRVQEVVVDVLENPALFEDLIDGLSGADPVVRMRAADAVEKITADRPAYLQPFKQKLIRLARGSTQQEVRWHMAQVLPRLTLTPPEKKSVVEIFFAYLDDQSKIVLTFALQALADFAADDEALRPRVIRVLEAFNQTGSPAVKSRGRKLLARLRLI